ncbi:DUF484 family protein [Thiocystis violacea]|uniref:DUF484 family protein n=1 Tax=Thiocystis violacea TaxID=13725 RepID=UPI001905E3D7|nr:DUF484 family protein [Thiocystis violacea]MBK1720240.1 hypothetical protein [Thiocystis violacea]
MSRQQAEQNGGEDPDLERLVADYLLQHPDFLSRNTDLLAAIQVPHLVGGAVSLIEHQVRILRRQLEAERHRLTHLISRAREYEALSTRLHGLVLQLMAVDDADTLCHLLREAMLREFHAEALAFKLFALGTSDAGSEDPLTAAFHDFIDREHALCGPLSAERAVMLFGDMGGNIKTAALVPIRVDGQSGVLAIGSEDIERFHPDMGTDFLDRLGELISQKLRTVRLAHCRHS